MSKKSIQEFECRECKEKGEYTIYDTVNVSLNPKLRDDVISLDIYKWICPKCGKHFNLMYPFVYHDMLNKFMLWIVSGTQELPEDLMTDMLEGYTFRSVNDINQLREKIYILEAGLDDRVIELVKLVMMAGLRNEQIKDPELKVPKDILFCEYKNKDLGFVFVDENYKENTKFVHPDIYDRLKEDLANIEDEIDCSKFCEVNLEWAIKTVEKINQYKKSVVDK